MAKIDLQVTVDGTEEDNAISIFKNLSNDLGTLEDRLQGLENSGKTMQLKVEKGEIIATIKEA